MSSKPPSKEFVVPSIEDFSPVAIRKALIQRAFTHPLTTYSAAGAVGTAIAGGLLGFSGMWFVILILLCGTTGFSVVWNLFLNAENFQCKHIQELHRRFKEQKNIKRQILKEKLQDLGCGQGCQQLDQLENKLDVLTELLGEKLNTSEVTYQKYLATAREVYLSAIDNLSDVSSALKSIRTINVFELKKRLYNARNSKEKAALEERIYLFEEEEAKISKLLVENEKAITDLDKAIIAISSMNTGQAEAEVDMENSMKDLSDAISLTKEITKMYK